MRKNLIQALKKLLVAFGGAKNTSEVTDTNIVPIVDKLADAVEGFNPDSSSNRNYLLKQKIITSLDLNDSYRGSGSSLSYEDDSLPEGINWDLISKLKVEINNQLAKFMDIQAFNRTIPMWYTEEDNITNCIMYGSIDNSESIWFIYSLEDFDFSQWDPTDPNTYELIENTLDVEIYEIIENKTIELPTPSLENVGQVLTSVETETDTYAFGFTTPTNNENNNMVITESFVPSVGQVLDKTWNEIATHMKSGGQCSVIFNGDNTKVSTVSYMGTTQSILGNNVYCVMIPYAVSDDGDLRFSCYTCDTINDYPLIAGLM